MDYLATTNIKLTYLLKALVFLSLYSLIRSWHSFFFCSLLSFSLYALNKCAKKPDAVFVVSHEINLTSNPVVKEKTEIQSMWNKFMENFPVGLMVCRVSQTKTLTIDNENCNFSKNKLQVTYMNKITKKFLDVESEEDVDKVVSSLEKYETNHGKKSDTKINSYVNFYQDILNHHSTEDFIRPLRYHKGESVILVNSSVLYIEHPHNIYSNGEFYKLISIENFSDERKYLQNNLYKNLRSQFLLTISHELNNPLTGLLHYSEKLMRDESHSKRTKYLNNMKKFKFCIKFFIKNLTLFSKIILKEKLNLSPINISLGMLISGVIDKFQSFFESKKIKYNCDMKDTTNIVLFYDYECLRFFLKNVFMYVCYKIEDHKNFKIESEICKERKSVKFNFFRQTSNKGMYKYTQVMKSENDISFHEDITIDNTVKTEEMLKEIIDTLSVHLGIKLSHGDFGTDNFLSFEMEYKDVEMDGIEGGDEINEFTPHSQYIKTSHIDLVRRSLNIEKLLSGSNSKINLTDKDNSVSQCNTSRYSIMNKKCSVVEEDFRGSSPLFNNNFSNLNKNVDEDGINKLKKLNACQKNLSEDSRDSVKYKIPKINILPDLLAETKNTPLFRKKDNYKEMIIESIYLEEEKSDRMNQYEEEIISKDSIEQCFKALNTDSPNKILIKKTPHNTAATFKVIENKEEDINFYKNISFNGNNAVANNKALKIFNFNIDLNLSFLDKKPNGTPVEKRREFLSQVDNPKTTEDQFSFKKGLARNSSSTKTLSLKQIYPRKSIFKKSFERKPTKGRSGILDTVPYNVPVIPIVRSNSFSCSCKRILIVDDESFNVNTLKHILKKSYKIFPDCCSNGQEAVNKVSQNFDKSCCGMNYKLIFMDVMMPVMDGIEASQKIQKLCDDMKTNINIVIISAHDGDIIYQRVKGIKIVKEFVSKPVKKSKIEELLCKYYFDV